MRYFTILILSILLGASCGPRDSGLDELNTRTVTLPGGQQIIAEVKTDPKTMQYGMMYRDSLPKGRGMLFVHQKPGPYTYWMHNVRIPLDIIFMNPRREIVGIAVNAPPCLGEAASCPHFGGAPNTQFVLELAGGESKRLGLRAGSVLTF
jgi:uncharacterized membrane protein (UPF0127 family)